MKLLLYCTNMNDNIDLTVPNVFRGKERIERNKQIKKVLWYCYGIKVKAVKINSTKTYCGYTFYLPYCIKTTNDPDRDDIACTLWNRKVYETLEEILFQARKGELELI